jgi:hypothetical protein
MSDIYKLHDAAFYHVSSWIISKDGEKLATISIKHPRDGASRLYAYVHWLGIPMVRGFASGYGYDKRSAAVANAVNHKDFVKEFNTAICSHRRDDTDWQDGYHAFRVACAKNGGEYFYHELENAGFIVWQAV